MPGTVWSSLRPPGSSTVTARGVSKERHYTEVVLHSGTIPTKEPILSFKWQKLHAHVKGMCSEFGICTPQKIMQLCNTDMTPFLCSDRYNLMTAKRDKEDLFFDHLLIPNFMLPATTTVSLSRGSCSKADFPSGVQIIAYELGSCHSK